MEPILQVKDLTHTYGAGTPFQRSAVEHMSFDVNEGEFLGIIGHTGSGKSTLIQHLNGLLQPTAGEILLRGKNIWSEPKKIREVRFKVGLVFQYPEYQLFEETVYKDIAFGPANQGKTCLLYTSDSSMPMDLKFMRQALAAIYYGDLLMTLRAQTQPYELEAGAAERLQNKWLDILCDEVRHDKGYSGREMKAVMPKIAAEFAAIPVRRVPKVKVGVVGEIYVKYSPLGNNELEKFLASQDCEVNLPGLMGFVQYCAYNMAETVRLYGGSLVEKTAAEAALALIAGMEKVIIKTLKDAGYHAPMPFSELIKLPEQSHTIGMGCKMGEGWLLTAEMLELVRSGYENIVCAQPFGCLPNHICGKGMVNKIRELYPEANITPIDYDPSATRVNQENRIKLMLAVARERLSERREPPADLPKVRTSVSAKLTKPKSLCANI